MAVLAAVCFSVAVLVILPRATHGVALTVLTGSMTPKIPVGSVVVDRPVDPGTLHVGDVATYQRSAGKAEYITHRIIAINTKTTPTTFIFKGDANRGPDIAPVPATAIRGRVWFHLPYLGGIRDSVQSRGMRSTLLVLVMAVLAAYAGAQLLSAARDRRHPGRAQPPTLPLRDGATVLASIPLDALKALSPQAARTLVRARLVEETPSGYLISLDAPQGELEQCLQLLCDLRATHIDVTDAGLTSGIERLRSRTMVASHA